MTVLGATLALTVGMVTLAGICKVAAWRRSRRGRRCGLLSLVGRKS